MTVHATLPTPVQQGKRKLLVVDASHKCRFDLGYRIAAVGNLRCATINPKGVSYEQDLALQTCECVACKFNSLCKHIEDWLLLASEQLASYAWRSSRLHDARLRVDWTTRCRMDDQRLRIAQAATELESLLENARDGLTLWQGGPAWQGYVKPMFDCEVE